MPQKTNLNVGPYYDDFDKYKNFYKVLFRPGFPIQARELTTSQSILQNQIESLARGMNLKDGSVVLPGGHSYIDKYYSIKVNSEHLGIDILLYADKLVGKKIVGQSTKIVAKIDQYLNISEAENITNLTFFINYLDAGKDNKISFFENGEILLLEENEESFTFLDTVINPGDSIATLISKDSCAIGTCAKIEPGVFFIRGALVDVTSDKLVLDAYKNNSSYRVGLSVSEEIISSKDDSSLNDNAKGFSNYSAPGANRLKIFTKLSKKPLDDFDDTSFVELFKVKDGLLIKTKAVNPAKDPIKDYIALRTYDESGNYSVKDYDIEVKESLNNNEGNGGIYLASQSTKQGGTPSDDLMCIKFGPGKSYVKGYDIETISSTIIDVKKPRDKETVTSSSVSFEFGSKIIVNNVSGTPLIGLNTTSSIRLFNQRKSQGNIAGITTYIGDARVYSFNLSDAPYSNAASQWDLYLFDVQTYTILDLNQTLTTVQCPETTYIKGQNSGASGYVTANANGSSLITLSQTSGTFSIGEQISISGVTTISRTIKTVREFGVQDIKSMYQEPPPGSGLVAGQAFSADTVLYPSTPPKFSKTDAISITGNNQITGIVTCPGKFFSGIKTDTIISYQMPNQTVPNFNKVLSVAVNGTSMTVGSIPSVAGICSGAVETINNVQFQVLSPKMLDKGGLYASLPNINISSLNLNNSNITISKQITGEITDAAGTLTAPIPAGISSAFFDAYDSEKYAIIYSTGAVEDLTSEQVTIDPGGSSITITGLTANQTNVVLNATLEKQGIKQKEKQYVRSESLIVSNSNSISGTESSGLAFNSHYGLRVQDEEISLNRPDVANIVVIYESLSAKNPADDDFLDSITVPTGKALNTNSILGEKIFGSESGAIAKVIKKSTANPDTTVSIVYINSNKFIVGEIITFEESKIETLIVSVAKGLYQDVTSHFTLDKGQKDQYYDYSRIVRKKSSYVPSHRLLVIYDYYTTPSNDTGDVYTVNSYPENKFKTGIPLLPDNKKASDTLDFRPKVAQFTATDRSPFAFSSRNFGSSNNTAPLVLTPNENSLLGYEYYLPRVDRLYLDKNGIFNIVNGVSSLDPKLPEPIQDAMELAQIKFPAYLYNVGDAKITLIDNRRYTMRDIGKIDDRVTKLENLTSLSLLETDTKTLQVKDADGLDKFKSGFFVDDFQDTLKSDPATTAKLEDISDESTNLKNIK